MKPKAHKTIRGGRTTAGKVIAVIGLFGVAATSQASILIPSDGAAGDLFGGSVSLSVPVGLSGARFDDENGSDSGSAYLFRDLDTTSGVVNQNAKLLASDGSAGDQFGSSVSVSSFMGLIGARADDLSGSNIGSAYVFRSLNTATGSVNENAKLRASDGSDDDFFGGSVSVSNSLGLVGSVGNDDNGSVSGSAYVFRNLDTATGTVTENAKLLPSDGAAGDRFGSRVSLSGAFGLIGAYSNDSAYVFRNLDTASGTVTENAKLTASDAVAGDFFGISVSQSDTQALVGAQRDDDNGSDSGSAYLFRNLHTASGTVTENAKLLASDGATDDSFGGAVSHSGNLAIVGAIFDDDNGSNSGSVYLFRNLNTATGTVNEDVKLLASGGAADDFFGVSVSLDGDLFTIGASGAGTAGQAYSGSVSSVTTLDEGSTSRTIDGISFESRTDWIIGETTDNNEVTLTGGDTADVTEPGMAVYIGKNAGSDNNRLVIEGDLTANEILVGAAGNTGNALEIDAGGSVIADLVVIAPGSSLIGDLSVGAGDTIFGSGLIDGNLTLGAGGMLEFAMGNTLEVTGTVSLDPSFGVDDITGVDSSLAQGVYTLIDGTSTDFSTMGIENWGSANAYDLGGGKSAYFSQGSLELNVIPEPETYGAILGLMGLGLALMRRRRR